MMTSRILVLCDHNPFPNKSGSTAYLKSVIYGLRQLDNCVRVSICRKYVLQYGDRWLDQNGVDERIMGSVKICRRLITIDPIFFLRRLRVLATRRRRPHPKPWRPARLGIKERSYVKREIKKFEPDIVISNYFPCVEHVAGQTNIPLVVLTHDLFALRKISFESAKIESEVDDALLRRERATLDRATAALYISKKEFDFGSNRYAAQPFYLPHCVDVPKEFEHSQSSNAVLFVGSAAAPNLDALDFLISDIWPKVLESCPDASLNIVGDVGLQLSHQRIEGVNILGRVENLSAIYAGAKVCVAPLRFGSGLKIKIVEALGFGCPVVTTRVGAEGLEQAERQFLRIADCSRALSKAIIEFLDRGDLDSAQTSASDFVVGHYGPEAMTERLCEMIDTIKKARSISSSTIGASEKPRPQSGLR